MSTLPPTTHALPQTHRAHLIQSTRKLGALLGETPLLLEPQGHHSRNSSISSISSTTSNESNASKRSGRIFADAQPRSSSLAPADPALVSTATHAPRPVLLLRLASPRPTSMVSPISPSFQLSPITPTFVVDRRKKMAKLVRTLGTNVPPELVFSAAPKTAVPNRAVPAVMRGLSPAHGSHRRGMSDISFANSTLASPTREAAHASQAYYASTPGSDDGWVDLGPSSYPPSPCSPRYVKASPTWDAAFADDMYVPARSASPPPRPSTTSRSTDDSRFLSRHYEFSVPSCANSPHPSSRPVSPYEDEDDDEPVATYRKEQGWSGEWSGAQGMEDVVKSLRRLK